MRWRAVIYTRQQTETKASKPGRQAASVQVPWRDKERAPQALYTAHKLWAPVGACRFSRQTDKIKDGQPMLPQVPV